MGNIGLVVGGDGLIGERIVTTLRRAGRPVEFTTRRSSPGAIGFDLASPDLTIFKSGRFDVVFVCAAVTSMAACETAPEETAAVNVAGTLATIRAAADAGAHIIFFSSSQVLDGEIPLADESAAPAPKNTYGRQKLAVERAIADEKLPAAAVRVTKVLSDTPVGMFLGWHRNLSQGQPAVAATNMTLAPVSAQASADMVIALGDARQTGLWHLSSSDEMSYYDAALRMSEICGLPRHLVRGEAVTGAQVPDIFRHRYTALATAKAAALPRLSILDAATTLSALFGRFPAGTVAGAN